MNETQASWEKLFNPELVKKNLVAAGVFLVAYELLQDSIVLKVRDFFTHEWTADGGIPGPEYKDKVLSLSTKETEAFALWLKIMSAIDDNDVAALKLLADHRNSVAHELPKFISSVSDQVSTDLICVAHHITHKIDQWWLVSVELPTDPGFNPDSFSDDDLNSSFSMRSFVLSLLVPLAEGYDSRMRNMYAGGTRLQQAALSGDLVGKALSSVASRRRLWHDVEVLGRNKDTNIFCYRPYLGYSTICNAI